MKELWICPKCGVRLVSKNLSHSCGRFTLETLLAKSTPETLELAKRYVSILRSLGDVQVIPQKTRLTCVARVRFAGLLPRKDHFLAGFGLGRRLDSPRIVKIEDYGPRWQIHHVRIRAESELDDELRDWLQESHDITGLQAFLNA